MSYKGEYLARNLTQVLKNQNYEAELENKSPKQKHTTFGVSSHVREPKNVKWRQV